MDERIKKILAIILFLVLVITTSVLTKECQYSKSISGGFTGSFNDREIDIRNENRARDIIEREKSIIDRTRESIQRDERNTGLYEEALTRVQSIKNRER